MIIEFRVRDVKRKIWRDDIAVDSLGNQYSWQKVSRVDGEDRYAYVQLSNNFLEINFYIGQKDKFGKKIYEGDIVQRYNDFGIAPRASRRIVKYVENHNHAGFNVGLSRNSNNLEVIGNIYDNPELLKELGDSNE